MSLSIYLKTSQDLCGWLKIFLPFCKTSPESHCCLIESIRCTGRTGHGLSSSWCPRTGEISQDFRDCCLSTVFSLPPCCTAGEAQNRTRAHIELTHSYWRSNSEENERRLPTREVSDNHAVYAWAALCCWVYECFSAMLLCWSHPSGMDAAFWLLDCFQQR